MISVSKKSIYILRITTSLIFIVAGSGHIIKPEKIASKLVKSPIGKMIIDWGIPEFLFQLSGIPLIAFGLTLAIGYKIKWSSLSLLALLIPITFTAQIGSSDLIGGLFKNIALMGVLIFFILNHKSMTGN